MNTRVLIATAASAQSNGVTTTANGATIPIGGVAPNNHAWLRFNTSAIAAPPVENLVSANLSVAVSAVGSTPMSVSLWVSNFGTALANADYNLAASNILTSLRVALSVATDPLIPSSATAPNVYSLPIPTRYITERAAIDGFVDFELRPQTASTLATQLVTIGGAAAAAGSQPTLTVITLSSAELNGSTIYRFEAVGAESFVAFAQETTEGVAVMPTVILDADQIGLVLNATTIRGTGFSSNRVKPRKSAVGRTAAGGSISFDLTPEKCFSLFPGVFKLVSYTGAGPYVYTFKVGSSASVAPFTFAVKKGAFIEIFNGCKIGKMTLSIGLDAIVRVTIDVAGLNKFTYDWASAGNNYEYVMDPTAAYDSVQDGLWSFVDSTVTVNGIIGDFIQSFSLDIMNDLKPRRGLNGKRGPTSNFALGFEVGASFKMYFQDDAVIKQFLGVAAAGYPYVAGKTIQLADINFTLQRSDVATILSVELPKAEFVTIGDAIQSEDVVELDIQTVANYDETSGSNITVTLTTVEPPSVFAPSTNVITVLPNFL